MSTAAVSRFAEELLQCRLLDKEQRAEVRRLQKTGSDSRSLAQEMLRRDWLTAYQINQIFLGKGSGLALGPYVMLDLLGEGGMGKVFKARHQKLNRVVALKIIRPDCLGDPKTVRRFQREIRTTSQFSHPNIVRAFDADQVDGTHYFAMELVDGMDLSKLVKKNGPLRVEQACDYIRQAALGLQHAMERGMVHRDIKPANLLVTMETAGHTQRKSGSERLPWGVVKILDMGLARCSDPSTGRSSTHLTQFGSLMGTPDFIAPEQVEDAHEIDIRADLYSLGCTLYFLLTGQPPFPGGATTDKLLRHQSDEPESLVAVRRTRLVLDGRNTIDQLNVPVPVVGVVTRLMAKDPADRFQTPLELARTLQAILHQMDDGTLPRGASVMAGDTQEFLAMTPVAPEREREAHPTMSLICVPPPRAPGIGLGRASFAVLAGLGVVVIATLIAALSSRGDQTHASPMQTPAVKKASK